MIVGISNVGCAIPFVGGAGTRSPNLWQRPSMSVGNTIRTLRKGRGLTQSALAAALGWERGTIAAVETGADQPGRELVTALAAFFQVSADTILGRDGAPQPAKAETEAEAELLQMFRAAPPDGKAAVLTTLRVLVKSSN